jgi:hypothetical protein
MNNITEAEVEKVIEYYAFPVYALKQVLIGDVLEKLIMIVDDKNKTPEERSHAYTVETLKLCGKWAVRGFSKSLQQIVEESGWEVKKCSTPTSCPPHTRAMCMGHEVLKSPEASALFEFLLGLLPKK